MYGVSWWVPATTKSRPKITARATGRDHPSWAGWIVGSGGRRARYRVQRIDRLYGSSVVIVLIITRIRASARTKAAAWGEKYVCPTQSPTRKRRAAAPATRASP